MQVKIQIKGLQHAAKLRSLAAQKLELAVARFAHAIQEASMWLGDINGPERGGVDKLCRVVLRMKNSSVVVIEDLGADVVQVLERVLGRLPQCVSPHCAAQPG
jgi:hypothetical protein